MNVIIKKEQHQPGKKTAAVKRTQSATVTEFNQQ